MLLSAKTKRCNGTKTATMRLRVSSGTIVLGRERQRERALFCNSKTTTTTATTKSFKETSGGRSTKTRHTFGLFCVPFLLCSFVRKVWIFVSTLSARSFAKQSRKGSSRFPLADRQTDRQKRGRTIALPVDCAMIGCAQGLRQVYVL